MQEKYWNYLIQVKTNVEYLDVYAEKTYLIDRNIRIICAVASSSAIAAWAIWTNLAFAWSAVIVASQVLSAVKDILPFSQRMKMLKELNEAMKNIFQRMEFDWYKVSDGQFTETEINEILFYYKREVSDAENKFMSENILVEREQYTLIAEEKCEKYFQTIY